MDMQNNNKKILYLLKIIKCVAQKELIIVIQTNEENAQ